jgi:type II secretory pathway pseudopilin PulG
VKNSKFKIQNSKILNLKFLILNSGSGGFTLAELLIAVTITILAMAAVYTTFIAQQRSFSAQDQVSETDLSSKIAFDMIARDIRDAGFGYPVVDNPSINYVTGVLNINDGGGVNNSDTLTLIGGYRLIATLQNDVSVGSNQITINYTGSVKFNKTNRSNLSIEGVTFASISDCTLDINNDCSGTAALTLDRSLDKPFPAGRPVYLVEDITYRVVTATGSNCNNSATGTTCLERVRWINNSSSTETLVNNIDDFQIAQLDQDSDGTPDRLRITLLARTAAEDLNLEPSTKPYYPSITIEGNTTSENDRYRRRIWSMEVAFRNPR